MDAVQFGARKEIYMADNTTSITIDASALASFDYSTYISTYFDSTAGIGATAGSSTWYPGYTDAPQVGFRYGAATNSSQVVLEGDFSYSRGVYGSLSGFTLGSYTSDTTTDSDGLLTGVTAGLVVSGFDITQDTASTDTTTNALYALYRALQKGNVTGDVDLNQDGTISATENVDYIYSVLASYAQQFIGSAGVDTYTGTDYADTIESGAGKDALDGGAGNDIIDGGVGADTMAGGLGDDTFYVDNKNDVVTENADEGTDTVSTGVNNYTLTANVENLTLTGSAGFGYGNELANAITGNAMDNDLFGAAGDDTIDGGNGADLLDGGNGNDTMIGGNGTDFLKGGNGNDTLTGGAGQDEIIGGKGADTFVFLATSDTSAKASKADTIYDFSASQGDIIDLSGIDANESKNGDQAFKFIGADAFDGKAGELRSVVKDGETYVSGDTDGDGKADFMIHLDQSVTFQADYFAL